MRGQAKTVGLVMLLTVIARLMGLLSTQVYNARFGVSLQMEIFTYAANLPNILFNSLSTALVTLVIPVFAGYLAAGKEAEAHTYARRIMTLALAAAGGITLIAMPLVPVLVSHTRFGTEGSAFAVTSIRVMLPVMLFFAATYVFQGILQSCGKFTATSLMTLPGGLLIIGYAVFLGPRFGVPGLLAAMFLSLSLQALVQWPSVRKTGWRFRPDLNLKDRDVRQTLKLLPPVIVGASAFQLNMFFNLTMASRFEGGTQLLTMAQTLLLVAVSTLALSITQVIFPRLTEFVALGDMKGFAGAVRSLALNMTFLMLPAGLGMAAVSRELLSLLFGWGKMTQENIRVAGVLFALYALGCWGLSMKEAFDRAFYALRDSRTPAMGGILMMVLNIGLGLALMPWAGLYAVPAAYATAATLTSAFLAVRLYRRVPDWTRGSLPQWLKMVLSALVMGAVTLGVMGLLPDAPTGQILADRVLRMGAGGATGVIVYGVLMLVLKPEPVQAALTSPLATKLMRRLRGA